MTDNNSLANTFSRSQIWLTGQRKAPGTLGTQLLLALLVTLSTGHIHADSWTLWESHDPDSNLRVDHSDWQIFLDQYVIAHEDGINRVAYDAARQTNWPGLQRYLTNMAAIDPRSLSRNEQMAYWINLYNALTVELVLRHPGKASIRRMGRGLLPWDGPWDDEVFSVAGLAITLNDIEHRILRPLWRDHRIHYAVNCASLGCPNLSREAFRAERLEQQLNEAEAAYLTHPRGVQFNAAGQLQLSSIFKWYRSDFATDEPGLLEHLAARHPKAEQLRRYAGRIRYDYDWALNAWQGSVLAVPER